MNKNDVRDFKFIVILWNTLSQLKEWKSIEKKIVLAAFHNPETNKKFYIHRNVVISNSTTLNEYYNKIKKSLWSYWSIGSVKDHNDYTIIIVELTPLLSEGC